MAVVGELLVMLGGSSAPLSAMLAKSEAELRAFSGSAKVHGETASGGLHTTGVAALGLATGMVVLAGESARAGAEFSSKMELIRTQAGASQQEVDRMKGAVLGLAPAVGIGPDQLADGLYHIESAGIRGSAALDVLKIAAEGAKVGHASLESVTGSLVGVVNSHIGGVHSQAEAMGVLNAIVGHGDMRMQDLASAMTTGILPAGAAFGVSLQGVGAALATMTNAHIPAEEAATRLRMTMSLLGAPSHKARDDLKGIGIGATQLATDMRQGGILQAVQDLKTHLDDSGLSAVKQTALLSDAFGGGRSSSAILTLLGNVDKFGQIQDQVTKGTGAFGDSWSATSEEAAFKAEQVNASMQAINDSIGLGLLPAVSTLLGAVAPLVGQFAQWASTHQDLVAHIILVTGAVAGLTAAVILGGAVIGALLSPIVLVIGGIAVLLAHFGLLGSGAKSAVDGFAGAFADMVPQVLAFVGDLVGQVLAQVPALTAAFVDWASAAIPPVLAALGDLASGVVAWIGSQAPVWAAQLQAWTEAFVGWVGPMIPPAIAALGDMVSEIAAWVASQAPAWMAQLGAWASAFVDWIGPMIPPLLSALGGLVGTVLSWIAAQVPGWVSQLQTWTQAFLTWAAPLVSNAIGALGDFAAALASWVAQQIPSVAAAAAPIAGAIIEAIVGGLTSAAGGLGDAIANGVGDIDPGQLAANIGSVLQSGAIIAAVVIAGQLVGAAYAAAYAGAAAAVKGATALITGAIAAEQATIAAAAGGVGAVVGGAFSTAFSVASAYLYVYVTGPLMGLIGQMAAPLIAAVTPVGTAVGTALDGALALGAAIGVPLLIAAIAAAIGVGLALLINRLFPGLAQAMSENFAKGVAAVGRFASEVSANFARGVSAVQTFTSQLSSNFAKGVAVTQGFAADVSANFAKGVSAVQTFAGQLGTNLAKGIGAVQTFIGQFAANIGTLPGTFVDVVNKLAAFLGGLPGQFFGWASKIGKAIVDGIMAGIGDIGKTVGDKLNSIPGVSLVGGLGASGVGVAQGVVGGVGDVLGHLPHFAGGGIIQGSGPTLAMLHPPEAIIPLSAMGNGTASPLPAAGGERSGAQVHETHIHVHLDGKQITEVVERNLFRNASTYSSGFLANSGVVGA